MAFISEDGTISLPDPQINEVSMSEDGTIYSVSFRNVDGIDINAISRVRSWRMTDTDPTGHGTGWFYIADLVVDYNTTTIYKLSETKTLNSVPIAGPIEIRMELQWMATNIFDSDNNRSRLVITEREQQEAPLPLQSKSEKPPRSFLKKFKLEL